MDKNIRIALVVCQSIVGQTEANLDNVEKWAGEARKQGAALVCFPELCITGYHVREAILPAAEPVPGPSTRRIEQIAASQQITILAGLAEKQDNGGIYASHIAMSPTGLIGIYRKLHLGPTEKNIFSEGRTVPPLVKVHGAAFGTQLCYDAHFPELSAKMAVEGADILLFPHASPGKSPAEKRRSWMRHLSARAFDNSVYVMAVNPVGGNGHGLDFPGVAIVVGPDGYVLDEYTGDEETLLTADLSAAALDAVRTHPMRYFLPNRRPELY